MPRGSSAYHRELEAARAVGLGMTRSQAEAFIRLLEQWAEDLATRVTGALSRRGDRVALRVAQEMIRQMTRDLATSTGNGVAITARRVAQIYGEATVGLLGASGFTGVTVGTLFPGLAVQAAQAVVSRPELSAAFRSIRRGSVDAVDAILQRAILRGSSSTQLAMELRTHILGAEVIPNRFLLDRRRIGYEALRQMGYIDPSPADLQAVRQMAGKVAGRAQLIARTETMNAEWEAHIRAAAESPVVEAIGWRTSTRHPKKDVCDILAEQDLYGLGPGVYDPRRVPPRPHPRCLCIQEDRLFERPEDFFSPRGPLPDRTDETARLIDIYELPPSQERMLDRALRTGETRYGRELAA